GFFLVAAVTVFTGIGGDILFLGEVDVGALLLVVDAHPLVLFLGRLCSGLLLLVLVGKGGLVAGDEALFGVRPEVGDPLPLHGEAGLAGELGLLVGLSDQDPDLPRLAARHGGLV